MKNFFSIAMTVFALSFFSCGGKIDSSNWLSNLDDGKKAATHENKRIFLFFSEDSGDGKSAKLKEKVFNTEEFLKSYTEKYVLVNIDYSESRYENDDENLSRDMRLFELYDAKEIPYFLVLSPEGFVITRLAFDENADFDSVRITFNEAEETIQKFEATLAKTKKGTTEERLAAINELVDSAEPTVVYHLRPLNELYISLDKKNESGDYLKHLIALTYAKAEDFLMEDEGEKAAEEFEKLTENKILTEDDKQMALYTAGYILAQTGSQNFEKIRDYFQKAYDVNPESEAGQNIKMSLNYVQSLIDGEGDDNASHGSSEEKAETEINKENAN